MSNINIPIQKENYLKIVHCQNKNCPEGKKRKYPDGRREDKSVDPGYELVKVELISPKNPNNVIDRRWVCFYPCLGVFKTKEIKRRLIDLPVIDLAVRWRYYADYRYVNVSLFAEKLPGVFENLNI